MKCGTAARAASVCILIWLSEMGCGPKQEVEQRVNTAPDREEAVFEDTENSTPMVRNGSAYEKAELAVEHHKVLNVPYHAEVRTDQTSDRIRIFMEKSLHFCGHPPEPMGIGKARSNMGCASVVEDESLTIGTYGEWDSKEGGTRIRLVIMAPPTIQVERKARLSGPRSLAQHWDDYLITKPKDKVEGYWYGPAKPAWGWTPIKSVPDLDCTAKKKASEN